MNTEIKVDVLAVMDYAAETFRRLNKASPEDHRLDIEDAEQARLAVAELVEALKASDEWVRTAKEQGCKLPCENTLRNNRAALAKFGGAA